MTNTDLTKANSRTRKKETTSDMSSSKAGCPECCLYGKYCEFFQSKMDTNFACILSLVKLYVKVSIDILELCD